MKSKLKKFRKTPIQAVVKKLRLQDAPVLFPEMSINPWHESVKRDRPGSATASGLTTLELCAGAGGQALGFEQAGIGHAGLVELDRHACATLRLNRPEWNVIEQDLSIFSGAPFKGVDIISGVSHARC